MGCDDLNPPGKLLARCELPFCRNELGEKRAPETHRQQDEMFSAPTTPEGMEFKKQSGNHWEEDGTLVRCSQRQNNESRSSEKSTVLRKKRVDEAWATLVYALHSWRQRNHLLRFL